VNGFFPPASERRRRSRCHRAPAARDQRSANDMIKRLRSAQPATHQLTGADAPIAKARHARGKRGALE
jgi:hypothetical protein